MQKSINNLRKIYLFLFVVCFILAGVLEFIMATAWSLIAAVMVFAMTGMIMVILKSHKNKVMQLHKWFDDKVLTLSSTKILFAIITIGVILRVAYYIWSDFIPTTDFQHAFDFYEYYKQNGPYTTYVDNVQDRHLFQAWFGDYPAWGAYMLFEWFILSTFGEHVAYIFVTNLMLYVGTSVLLFQMTCKGFGKQTGVIIAAFFAFFPQAVFWCAQAAPDHLEVFFLTLFFALWYKLYDRMENTFAQNVVFVLLMAVSMAMVDLFKPLKPLTVCILIASEILILKRPNYHLKKRFLEIGLCIVVYFILSGLFLDTIEVKLEALLKTDVTQVTPFYLMAGYTLNENGIVDPALAMDNFYEILNQYNTKAEGMAYAYKEAEKVLKSSLTKLPIIWAEKFVILFGRDRWAFRVTFNNETHQYPELFMRCIEGILTFCNGLSLIFVGISGRKKRQELLDFLSIGFLGYIAYLIIGAGLEARYRYLFIIPQVILTVIGIQEFKSRIKERNERVYKTA